MENYMAGNQSLIATLILYTGNKNDVVPVVVWELNHKTDIQNLDRYEGYPLYYTKRTIPVIMDSSGNEEQAMVYVMNKNRKGIYPPDAYYFNVIKEGYVANGIDLKPLYAAAEYSIDNDNITRYNQYNARQEDDDNDNQTFKKAIGKLCMSALFPADKQVYMRVLSASTAYSHRLVYAGYDYQTERQRI